MSCRVGLVYNLKRELAEVDPPDLYSEFDSQKTIAAIERALEEGGSEVVRIEADEFLIERLKKEKPGIVFNVAEMFSGESRESQVPALLDFLGIPYTASGPLALALSLNKAIAKKIFNFEGIPTPNFQLFTHPQEKLSSSLHFPLIVKPNCEGSAKGISARNVVKSETRLYEEIKRAYPAYPGGVLVEEFIEGKELTVGILEKINAHGKTGWDILPILEIDFSLCRRKSGEYFYSWRMKEYQGDKTQGLCPGFYCPARIPKELAEGIKQLALRSHQALGCRDFSRVDIRLSEDNIPYVLEVNALPGLDEEESNLTLIAREAGITYRDLINRILASARRRNGLVLSKKAREGKERPALAGSLPKKQAD